MCDDDDDDDDDDDNVPLFDVVWNEFIVTVSKVDWVNSTAFEAVLVNRVEVDWRSWMLSSMVFFTTSIVSSNNKLASSILVLATWLSSSNWVWIIMERAGEMISNWASNCLPTPSKTITAITKEMNDVSNLIQ